MNAFISDIDTRLEEIRASGFWKSEEALTTPQRTHVSLAGDRDAINLCANNYLGLADHPDLIAAAKKALDQQGFGMASVRFICGTQTLHREWTKHGGHAARLLIVTVRRPSRTAALVTATR